MNLGFSLLIYNCNLCFHFIPTVFNNAKIYKTMTALFYISKISLSMQTILYDGLQFLVVITPLGPDF